MQAGKETKHKRNTKRWPPPRLLSPKPLRTQVLNLITYSSMKRSGKRKGKKKEKSQSCLSSSGPKIFVLIPFYILCSKLKNIDEFVTGSTCESLGYLQKQKEQARNL